MGQGFDLLEPEMLTLETTPPDAGPDFCEMAVPFLGGADCFIITSYFPDAAM
ncbi:MAG: hypothetical protein ACFCU2_12325 [Acidimicrobiia bacterium]